MVVHDQYRSPWIWKWHLINHPNYVFQRSSLPLHVIKGLLMACDGARNANRCLIGVYPYMNWSLWIHPRLEAGCAPWIYLGLVQVDYLAAALQMFLKFDAEYLL